MEVTAGPEDESSMFLRDVGIYLQVRAAQQPRRHTSADCLVFVFLVYLKALPFIILACAVE
jgi:hypothetical protein